MSYVVTFAFIILDFITGLVMALTTGTFSSGVMREGLYKKLGLVLCMALGFAVDYAQVYIDLGVTVPVAVAVCGYICVMEIGSALENICKINPDIMPDKLTALFGSVLTTGSTGEQVAVSDVVATIADTVKSAMQEATEQKNEDTANEAVTDEATTTDTATETTTMEES